MRSKLIMASLLLLYFCAGCKSTLRVLQMEEMRPVLADNKDIIIEFKASGETTKRYLDGESYQFRDDTLITPFNAYLASPDTFKVPLHEISRLEYERINLATTILLGTAVILAGWLLLL